MEPSCGGEDRRHIVARLLGGAGSATAVLFEGLGRRPLATTRRLRHAALVVHQLQVAETVYHILQSGRYSSIIG